MVLVEFLCVFAHANECLTAAEDDDDLTCSSFETDVEVSFTVPDEAEIFDSESCESDVEVEQQPTGKQLWEMTRNAQKEKAVQFWFPKKIKAHRITQLACSLGGKRDDGVNSARKHAPELVLLMKQACPAAPKKVLRKMLRVAVIKNRRKN